MSKGKSVPPNGSKRRRGRPRKTVKCFAPGAVTIAHPFTPLGDEPIDDSNVAEIVAMIRKRREATPVIPVPLTIAPHLHAGETDPAQPAPPVDADLRDWLKAAADSLEKGDGVRATYYMLHAMRCREVGLARSLAELSEIGKQKLTSDKRRGRRVDWDSK